MDQHLEKEHQEKTKVKNIQVGHLLLAISLLHMVLTFTKSI